MLPTDIARIASSMQSLSDAVCPTRPAADESLEQFHLQSGSVGHQARRIAERFNGESLAFLGDDDHVSIVAAAFADVAVTVYEIDMRVVESLRQWANRLSLRDYTVVECDLRDLQKPARAHAAFYANPPFSSKNEAHGLRYWLDRALFVCEPYCRGILVMPSNEELRWVNQNWISVQRFASDNGCRITHIDVELQAYIGTNDLGLRSQNMHLARLEPSMIKMEPIRLGDAIYR